MFSVCVCLGSMCLKIVFQEEKNTDMNAIKHATQPTIQIAFWTLKIISQPKKNVKHKDPKDTHTLNKSNQFCIAKTS